MDAIEEFDYVVVGGGSAGCVLARRLSDDPTVTVLLLEAGPADGGAVVEDPARWTEALGGALDWGHEYEPAGPTGGRRIPIPRGKILGGSSAINALLWYRGDPDDYDAWDRQGATGWDFAGLLPYFRRSEDWEDGSSDWRGAGGPIRVERHADPHPIALALLDAAAETGLPVLDDVNAGRTEGAALGGFTTRGGRRCSAAVGYLEPVQDRSNLVVRCDSPVVSLVVDGTSCRGVESRTSGVTVRTRAARDVVLCAGALESPRLLMLAGIGPPDHLQELGIPVRVASPGVGAKLADHPLVTGVNVVARRPVGPVRGNGGGAVVNARSACDLAGPDLHAFVVQGRHAVPEVSDRYRLDDAGDVFALSPGLMRSRSVGTLRLTGSGSTDPLRLRPNLLADPADVAALAVGVDLVMDLLSTSAFRPWVASPAAPDRRLTRREREEFVRLSTSTFFHTAGTAPMGHDGVLDPCLRVHGLSGLRVADASAMPSLPSCNTNAPVIALAERAADVIAGRPLLTPHDPRQEVAA